MRVLAGQTYWLIGASEGLGRALARGLDAEGARLVLSARNGARLQGLAAELRAARGVAMDVTDPASVASAMAEIGPVDGLIYCAGCYQPVAAQDWQADAVQKMTEVNYLGALRVLGAILPEILRRGQGHLVLIGSLSGFRGLPGAIGYGASKAALMHLAENLAADLHGTDIAVQIVNPGFIRTRLTAKNDFTMPFIQTPEAAAERVLKAMRGNRFSTNFPAPFSWLFTLGRYLPRRLFNRLFR